MKTEALPPVAPWEACVACFRGDTKTRFAMRGTFTAHVCLLEHIGLPLDQAEACANASYDQKGEPNGEVPLTLVYCICEDCATTENGRVPVEVPGPNGELHVKSVPSDMATWKEGTESGD
jgi:hypothetical protein